MVEKDGKKYVLGCGFYPHSKADAVVTLVRGAVSTFYSYLDRGAGEKRLLATLVIWVGNSSMAIFISMLSIRILLFVPMVVIREKSV